MFIIIFKYFTKYMIKYENSLENNIDKKYTKWLGSNVFIFSNYSLLSRYLLNIII